MLQKEMWWAAVFFVSVITNLLPSKLINTSWLFLDPILFFRKWYFYLIGPAEMIDS